MSYLLNNLPTRKYVLLTRGDIVLRKLQMAYSTVRNEYYCLNLDTEAVRVTGHWNWLLEQVPACGSASFGHVYYLPEDH